MHLANLLMSATFPINVRLSPETRINMSPTVRANRPCRKQRRQSSGSRTAHVEMAEVAGQRLSSIGSTRAIAVTRLSGSIVRFRPFSRLS